MHVDPEFETFTYGDPTQPKARLRDLEEGDMLVFYAGLEGWDHDSPAALYIVGYFEVARAGKATTFKPSEIRTLFKKNAHVRHSDAYEHQKDRLVLVKGSPQSRLLNKAVRISEMGTNVNGRPLKVLWSEMRPMFGSFGGRNSLERSNPRWVRPEFVAKAARYVRSLR